MISLNREAFLQLSLFSKVYYYLTPLNTYVFYVFYRTSSDFIVAKGFSMLFYGYPPEFLWLYYVISWIYQIQTQFKFIHELWLEIEDKFNMFISYGFINNHEMVFQLNFILIHEIWIEPRTSYLMNSGVYWTNSSSTHQAKYWKIDSFSSELLILINISISLLNLQTHWTELFRNPNQAWNQGIISKSS